MRILVVANMYPPHHQGGYELSCLDVVERWRARGHEVAVLTTRFRRDDVGDDPTGDAAQGVRRTLEHYWRDHRHWLPGRRDVLALERHDQREVRTTLREVRPDVISTWNLGAVPLSVLATLVRSRIPLVHHVCNDWLVTNLEHDGLRGLLRRHRYAGPVAARLLGIPPELPDIGRTGSFCWVSRATWDRAEAGTPWRFPRSVVVHSGISHVDFPPVDAPAEARPWQGRLLFVGRIDGQKGLETVIDALALLDDATVDVLGYQNEGYVAWLLDRAADHGVRDRITVDTVSRSALRQRYLDADALLFTSTYEPFGLVPIEAMASATPVVASGAGGSKEFLVDGRNCLLYPTADAHGLAEQVRRLASDASLRLALAQGGLATAREFSVDRLADRLEASLVAAVGERAAAR